MLEPKRLLRKGLNLLSGVMPVNVIIAYGIRRLIPFLKDTERLREITTNLGT